MALFTEKYTPKAVSFNTAFHKIIKESPINLMLTFSVNHTLENFGTCCVAMLVQFIIMSCPNVIMYYVQVSMQ